MLAFLDESGDVGVKIGQGSSPFFVMALVIFQDNDVAEAADRRITEYRSKLRLHPHYEFKFIKLERERRLALLETITTLDFQYHAIVVDKAKLDPADCKDNETLYMRTSQLLVSTTCDDLHGAKIAIDRLGSKGFSA